MNICRVILFIWSPTGSLKDRHIKNGDVVYAIFTPKENLKTAPRVSQQEGTETCGSDTVRCHIMLKVRAVFCLDNLTIPGALHLFPELVATLSSWLNRQTAWEQLLELTENFITSTEGTRLCFHPCLLIGLLARLHSNIMFNEIPPQWWTYS